MELRPKSVINDFKTIHFQSLNQDKGKKISNYLKSKLEDNYNETMKLLKLSQVDFQRH